uniref:Integron gene cassette protein n=1 Tax=Macrostomum lignano TaxID=282301 RepID=A0A1I8HZG3_9PLAT
EKYIHATCLLSRYLQRRVYSWGRWQMTFQCPHCMSRMRVTRRYGRHTCDKKAQLSVLRHFLCLLVVSGLFLTFGLWSLIGGSGPNLVTVGLVLVGSLLAVWFCCYEIWAAFQRLDLSIALVPTDRRFSIRRRSKVNEPEPV